MSIPMPTKLKRIKVLNLSNTVLKSTHVKHQSTGSVQPNALLRSRNKNVKNRSPCIIGSLLCNILIQQTTLICRLCVFKTHIVIEILCMQLQKAHKHSLVHDAVLLWKVSQKLYWWEKNENRCFAGGRTDTKLANTVEKRCVSTISAVRDVSNDGNSRTHIVVLILFRRSI